MKGLKKQTVLERPAEHANKDNAKRGDAMYSPKIKNELIAKLYRLKEKTKTPMTVHVDIAVREYLRRKKDIMSEDKKESSDG